MVVVNIVSLCFQVLGFFALIVGIGFVNSLSGQDIDDDEVEDLTKIPFGLYMIILIVEIALSICGIMGAINYNKLMVYCAMAGYVIGIIANLFSFSIAGLIMSGCFLYPHFFFVKEMNEQIMTPENYPNEVYSCCCV